MLFNTQYQMVHIDRKKPNSMRTTVITLNNSPPKGVKTLVATIPHGYSYTPMVFLLWEIKYNAWLGGATQRGYEKLTSTTGLGPVGTTEYAVDSTNIKVYFTWSDPTNTGGNPAGTKIQATTYVGANDFTPRDYTV